MSYTTEHAMGVIETANQDCHDRTPFEIKPDDIARCLYFHAECNCGPGYCGSFCDSSSIAVAELHDGRFILAREDSDSSGHG